MLFKTKEMSKYVCVFFCFFLGGGGERLGTDEITDIFQNNK